MFTVETEQNILQTWLTVFRRFYDNIGMPPRSVILAVIEKKITEVQKAISDFRCSNSN